MASMSDARMYRELLDRVDKIEELLTTIADQVQKLAAGESDLMPIMYPEKGDKPDA
jgi:hypothetical protein